MRHKQILDVARDNPEASLADIAAEVPSATTDLVEHVLEGYGDPAEPDGSDGGDAVVSGEAGSSERDSAKPESRDREDGPPERTGGGIPDPGDISEKQRDTLRAIAADPEATQRELADRLGVTAATVSKRVNDIEGFDWTDRAASVFDSTMSESEPTVP